MKASTCECGHPKSAHAGHLTNGDGWKTLSTTACLAGTSVARIGNWHAERVGGDYCPEYQRSWRLTLRAVLDLARWTAPSRPPAGVGKRR